MGATERILKCFNIILFRLIHQDQYGSATRKLVTFDIDDSLCRFCQPLPSTDEPLTLQTDLPDHVGVVKLLQPPKQRHLSDRGHWEAILVRLDPHALQSHKPPAHFVPGLVDGPISPASNFSQFLVGDAGALGHGRHQTGYKTSKWWKETPSFLFIARKSDLPRK